MMMEFRWKEGVENSLNFLPVALRKSVQRDQARVTIYRIEIGRNIFKNKIASFLPYKPCNSCNHSLHPMITIPRIKSYSKPIA